MSLLLRLGPPAFKDHHPAVQLAMAFVVSTLALSFALLIAYGFSAPSAARLISLAWLAGAIVLSWIDRASLAALGSALTAWEKAGWALTALMGVLWLALIPLSPYPAILTEGLGDRPSYYRLAANLVNGDGWLMDFYTGDYIGGALVYAKRMPIPVLATTHLFHLFGQNLFSLGVFATCAGGLMVILGASLVSHPAPHMRSSLTMLMVFAMALSIGSFQKLIGLGAESVPGALALLSAAGFYMRREASAPLGVWAVSSSLLFALFYRPEVAIFGLLLVAGYPLAEHIFSDRFKTKTRLGLAGTCLAMMTGAFLLMPTLLDRLPTELKNLSIFYVGYDETAKEFDLIYDHWSLINKDMARIAFSDDASPDMIINARVGEEIRAHPFAFTAFLIESTYKTLGKTPGFLELRRFISHERIFIWMAMAVLLMLLIEARTRSVMLTCIAFLIIFPIFNINPAARLLLPAGAIMLTILGYHLALRDHRVLLKATGRLWLPLAITLVCFSVLARGIGGIKAIRLADENTLHGPILTALKKVLEPGDLVATSYPQLVSCETGNRTVGCSWLTEFLPGIIRKSEPDIIVFEDVNKTSRNYTWMKTRTGMQIAGYELVVHQEDQHFAIFRKLAE
jgi:hypothetical protein